MSSDHTADQPTPAGSATIDLTKFSKLEIMLARALYQTDYLMHSVYLNLGKDTLPIYNEQQRRMREELVDPVIGPLCNYVGPMTPAELGTAIAAASEPAE